MSTSSQITRTPTCWLRSCLVSGFALVLLWPVAARADDAQAGFNAEMLFAAEVYPLLEQKCFACHGTDDDDRYGELDLTSRTTMLAGGETSQEVLVPGDASASLLYQAVTWSDPDYEMPPKENDRLTAEQSWMIRDWINGGAPWPDKARRADLAATYRARQTSGVEVATSGGLSDSWNDRRYEPENLWAYQPVEKPEVPRQPATRDDPNPIDAFINRRLADVGLQPAPRAKRRLLIRRATFDLLGLPPTPDEIARFVQDPGSDEQAFAKLVDRLLESPHYGEQWGRHWLDVVRYADTSGFANDYERPNAWRYRDYVTESFNQDKPYDQFVREQLAGDEIDPQDPEMLIAAGFLRMGPWEQTGMSVEKITRQQFLDDVTDSVGQVFLSHPLQCCRCHDHKFDPIPARDYYRIQAVFATTQFAERDAAFAETENQDGFESDRKLLEDQIQRYEAILDEIRAKEERAARAWYAERGLEYAPRQQLMKQGVSEDKIAPRHVGLDTQDFGIERVARKNLTRHRWELDRYRPIAFSVYSGLTRKLRNVQSRLRRAEDPRAEGVLEPTAILAAGNPYAPGEKVTPGVLSCLPESNDRRQANDWNTLPDAVAGRRRAFADWVASPRNSLTARSIVNRIWQYHFGRGIARTPNNFGNTGKKPTHAELLDWLAATFVEDGWSLKTLHRRIMLSDVYCRSAAHPRPAQLSERDPEDELYARCLPRRLSAEELRDSMLAISGELNPQRGGLPVRPDMNLEAALQPRQIMGTYAPAYQPSPLPRQRNRRSIYAQRIRGLRDPFFEVFNQPSPEVSCARRDVSTVTPQVFALFNSKETYDRALAFAARLRAEGRSSEDTLRRAFRLAYGRQPSADELQPCLRHWQAMSERHSKLSFARREPPARITRMAVEEMSGESFSFVEELDVYADYVSDLEPWQVDADTRGLAEVCLVLFNSNEFIYVY